MMTRGQGPFTRREVAAPREGYLGRGLSGKLKLPASVILVILFTFGCGGMALHRSPFRDTPRFSMESSDPQAVIERFYNAGPEEFRLLTSVVFKYKTRRLSGIGCVDINKREETYAVACVNALGVKLFEISGNRSGIVSHYALEYLSDKGDFASAVGEDIKSIYFDPPLSGSADMTKKKYKIVVSRRHGAGEMEYVFAGAEGNMIEKKYYEGGALVWRISYHEYITKNGKIYPGGVILRNYKFGYSLTVKMKEILA